MKLAILQVFIEEDWIQTKACLACDNRVFNQEAASDSDELRTGILPFCACL